MLNLDTYITEKLHLTKEKANSDDMFIDKWTEIINKHYRDWVKYYESKMHKNYSTDAVIKKEIKNIISWLNDHRGKPELHNFEESVAPFRFIEYLKEKEII